MALTLCPVALAAGCRRCPIFSVCPLKSVIGDQPSASAGTAPEKPTAKGAKPASGKGARKRG
jgi:hypothetical protein